MAIIKRGTQTLGRPNVVPGAIILDNDTSNLTNTGRGTSSIVPEKKRQSQQWTVTDAGVTSNDGGHGITVLDINTVNSHFQGLAYTFPNDGTTDDNSWTIDVALPTFMSATPNMVFRLFVQATGTGACGGGGGNEVFTGAKISAEGGGSQTIPDNSFTQLTTIWDTTVFDTDGYWDSGGSRFVVPTGLAGKFVICAAVQLDASVAGANKYGILEIDVGTHSYAVDERLLNNNNPNVLACESIVDLVDGDIVRVYVKQTSGGNLNCVLYGGDSFFFALYRYDKPA